MTDDIQSLRDQARSLARDIRGNHDRMNELLPPDDAFNMDAPPIKQATWDEWQTIHEKTHALEKEFERTMRRLLELKG